MLIDIRSYDPDRNVNVVGHAFDLEACKSAVRVARDMLAEAEAAREAANVRAIPREGMDPMTRQWADMRLAEYNATLIRGVLAQAEAAVASFPQDVVSYALQRFGI